MMDPSARTMVTRRRRSGEARDAVVRPAAPPLSPPPVLEYGPDKVRVWTWVRRVEDGLSVRWGVRASMDGNGV